MPDLSHVRVVVLHFQDRLDDHFPRRDAGNAHARHDTEVDDVAHNEMTRPPIHHNDVVGCVLPMTRDVNVVVVFRVVRHLSPLCPVGMV